MLFCTWKEAKPPLEITNSFSNYLPFKLKGVREVDLRGCWWDKEDEEREIAGHLPLKHLPLLHCSVLHQENPLGLSQHILNCLNN